MRYSFPLLNVVFWCALEVAFNLDCVLSLDKTIRGEQVSFGLGIAVGKGRADLASIELDFAADHFLVVM